MSSTLTMANKDGGDLRGNSPHRGRVRLCFLTSGCGVSCRPSRRWASSSPLPSRKRAFPWGSSAETSAPAPLPAQVRQLPGSTYGTDATFSFFFFLSTGKTAAFMLPVLERLVYKPRTSQVTRVLVLVPTRELGIQVHTVARQLAQFTSITTCLTVGTTLPACRVRTD